MNTSSFRKSLLSLAVVGILLPLAILDCTSSNSGSGSGNPDGGTCPAAAPTSGAVCFAAEGTICSDYAGPATPGCYCCNGGFAPSFECTKGKWQELATAAGGAPSNVGVACPPTVPKQGGACTPGCGGPQQQCSYTCETGGGNVSSATCVGGSWNVVTSEIACAVDAGVDASNDAADGAD